MVLIYHANPHLQTAINFAADPMLRFMHNVHTPAPYAYGWTGLSLLPGLVWFTKNFTLSFWAMKLFIAGFWLGQLWILQKLVHRLFPKEPWRFWLFALNPLVLVETLINGHNDVVMMFLALVSYWFFLNSKKFRSLLFLLLSASIKYVTILLLPFYLRGVSSQAKKIDLPTLFSLGLLLVMFIRPGQFHSWYFIWAFSFAVLSKPKWVVSVFTALTFGALLRYAPYLYYGHWDPPVSLLRNLIWLGSLVFAKII
jgi:Gpi18-like mannosyltransferase